MKNVNLFACTPDNMTSSYMFDVQIGVNKPCIFIRLFAEYFSLRILILFLRRQCILRYRKNIKFSLSLSDS
jgi:hypothetical protein